MNEALYQLYVTRQADFNKVQSQFSGNELAGPLLMAPNALYEQQSNPLLIVGQETKGWRSLEGDAIREQMTAYEEFNVGEEYYASPFWNVTRKVEAALGNAPYSCAWTNVSKFDVVRGRSYGDQEAVIATLDDLLVAEIPLLKPVVCLFFTGPDFDDRLQHTFPGLAYQPVAEWSERALVRLVHPALPANTFRTYHPNYLRRSGQEASFLEFMHSVKAAD
jgi:hypothetical protein